MLFILQMISVKNQEVENGGKSIHGLQTNLKKMRATMSVSIIQRSEKKQERKFSLLYTDSNTGATM